MDQEQKSPFASEMDQEKLQTCMSVFTQLDNVHCDVVILGYPPVAFNDKDVTNLIKLQIMDIAIAIAGGGINNQLYLIGEDYLAFHPAFEKLQRGNVSIWFDSPARVFSQVRQANAPPFRIMSSFTEAAESHQLQEKEQVLWICVNPYFARGPYDIAALVKTRTFKKHLWATTKTRGNLLLGFEHPIEVLDFFKFDQPDLEQHLEQFKYKAHFTGLIIEGIDCLRSWLGAGFHKNENNKPVPGWSIQTGGRWNSLVIAACRILPYAPDMSLQEAIFNDASFRSTLTLVTLRVLSVLIYTNYRQFVTYEIMNLAGTKVGLHQSPEDIDKAAWTSVELWSDIRRRLLHEVGGTLQFD